MATGPFGRGGGPSVGDLRTGVGLLEARLLQIINGLGGQYTIELALPNTPRDPPRTVRGRPAQGAQPSLSDVFGWFVHGTTRGQPARNVLTLTPGATQLLLDAVTTRFYARAQGGDVPNLGQLLPAVAYAWRDLVVRRLEAGGGDLNLAALSPAHRARKLRLGYPARIGTMTGQTLAAVRKAQPIIRRGAA